LREISGCLFGVVDHRDFGDGCLFNRIDNLFKSAGNFIAIRNFTALSANSGWNVLNNDNTVFNINGKGRISAARNV
jgi:2C-methyl-D-erythritol 2,4-cyclodiphosphate synthase